MWTLPSTLNRRPGTPDSQRHVGRSVVCASLSHDGRERPGDPPTRNPVQLSKNWEHNQQSGFRMMLHQRFSSAGYILQNAYVAS
jgi:hypothetical protein